MCHGNLNGFAVNLFCVLDSFLDGLLRLAGQSDDKVAVNVDADFLAVLNEGAAHFDRRALLDVLQDLRIAGFKANNQ